MSTHYFGGSYAGGSVAPSNVAYLINQAAPAGLPNAVDITATGSALQWARPITYLATTWTHTQPAATSGSPNAYLLTAGAHTTLAAGTEARDVDWNLARTVQFATGALATQRAIYARAPTYAFVGASTLTDAATFAISGAPVAGTLATITRSHALRVEAGQTSLGGNLVVGSASLAPADPGTTVTVQPSARTSGSPSLFLVTGPADTTLTAAEASDISLALNRTVSFDGTGSPTIARQRAILVQAPTYAFSTAAATITTAATLAITGPPLAGTNATPTNAYGLLVEPTVNDTSTTGSVRAGIGVLYASWAPASGSVAFRAGSFVYTVNQTGTASGTTSGVFLNATETAIRAAHTLADLQLGGNSVFTVTGSLIVANAGAGAGGRVVITPRQGTGGTPTLLSLDATNANHVMLATAEAIDVNFNLARTVQITGTGGTLATQRAMLVQAPTYAFTAAHTITDAATLEVSGAPGTGTNATLTRSHALRVAGGQTSLGGNLVVGSASTAASGTTLLLTPAQRSSGSPSLINVVAPTDGNFDASVEAIDISFSLGRTVTFATGAMTTQRAVNIAAPTYAFAGASALSTTSTLDVASAPNRGANATFTNLFGFRIGSANVTAGPTSAGLIYSTIEVPAHTVTVMGSTGVTSATGFSALRTGAVTISDASAVTVTNAIGVSIGAAPTITGTNTSSITTAVALQVGGAATIGATAAGQTYTAVDVPAHTITVLGTTSVTGSSAFNGMRIGAVTITDASAATVTGASSLYISGPPVQAGSITATNLYTARLEGTYSDTSGTSRQGLSISQTFNPGSGTVTYQACNISYTVNQVGTGGVTGIFLNATETAIGGTHNLLDLQTGGASRFTIAGSVTTTAGAGLVTMAPLAAMGGSPTLLTVTGPAHTSLAASVEAPDINFNLARTVQFATGAITTQRAVRVQRPTYGFVGASTITTATTTQIDGPPATGTNATITTAVGLGVGSAGNRSAATNAYGIQVQQPQIATGFGAMTTLAGLRVETAGGALGDQTATLTNLNSVRIDAITYTSTTNTRTVTNPAGLYIDAPVAGSNVTFTNGPFAIWCATGYARFDSRILGARASNVASANNLTLGAGNLQVVTGTTQINLIDNTGWTSGSLVVLTFTGSLTVKNNQAASGANQPILLSGAADFSATADDTLTLVYDTNPATPVWREVARTVI